MKNIKNAIAHLKQHQEYPAKKEQLVKACNELSDFSKADKEWFKENLPKGTYNSAEEVIRTLGWIPKVATM